MKETLERFIKNLEDEDFSGAHETMEQKWKEYKKQANPLAKLLKGFINGATAFELLNRGKSDGAKRLWAVYEKYLVLMVEDIEEHALFKQADERLQKLRRARL